MRFSILLRLLSGAMLACCATLAMADSWAPAQVSSYPSASGQVRLTVYPREISSPLAYFSDAVKDKDKPGQKPGGLEAASFRLERRDASGQWQTISTGLLTNGVAPVSAAVADDGAYFVTLDNWHSMGWGDNAVVIHAGDGSIVRRISLPDLLGEDYVTVLPHSVSSIHWRGDALIDDAHGELVVQVVLPASNPSSEPRYIGARIGLADGRFHNADSAEWREAMRIGKEQAALLRIAEAEQEQRFVAPLVAPSGTDEASWHHYLNEVFYRSDADWMQDTPATTVLRDPAAKNYRPSEGWLKDDLRDPLNRQGAVMIASPASLDNLVRLLGRIGPRLDPGALSQSRIYVVSDARHADAVRSALQRSGARIVIVDPAVPIPQRAARIRGTPEYEAAQKALEEEWKRMDEEMETDPK